MGPFNIAWALLKSYTSGPARKDLERDAPLSQHFAASPAEWKIGVQQPHPSPYPENYEFTEEQSREPPRQNTAEWMKYHGMDNPDSRFNLAADLHRNDPGTSGGFDERPWENIDENDLQYLVNQKTMTPEEAEDLRRRAALSMIGPDPEMPLE